MNNRAKNHHIVPKVLQKQFVIEGTETKIWRSKRNESGSYETPEKKDISRTFVKRDHYTVLENGQLSDLIEREFYSPLDNSLGNLISSVKEILQRGRVPLFDSDVLMDTRLMMIDMVRRTPDFMPDRDDLLYSKEYSAAIMQKLPDIAKVEEREKLEADLTNVKRLQKLGRDTRVRVRTNISPEIKELLSEFVPRWVISETNHSFILSSMMVYRLGNGGRNGLVNPEMEMWMPVTPKIILVLLRDPKNRTPDINPVPPKHIRKINEFAVKNSHEIASHSEALLKSLTGRR